MFMTVDETLVAATMLANEIAIWSMVAGEQRDRPGTEPRVTAANAIAVDVDATKPRDRPRDLARCAASPTAR